MSSRCWASRSRKQDRRHDRSKRKTSLCLLRLFPCCITAAYRSTPEVLLYIFCQLSKLLCFLRRAITESQCLSHSLNLGVRGLCQRWAKPYPSCPICNRSYWGVHFSKWSGILETADQNAAENGAAVHRVLLLSDTAHGQQVGIFDRVLGCQQQPMFCAHCVSLVETPP